MLRMRTRIFMCETFLKLTLMEMVDKQIPIYPN